MDGNNADGQTSKRLKTETGQGPMMMVMAVPPAPAMMGQQASVTAQQQYAQQQQYAVASAYAYGGRPYGLVPAPMTSAADQPIQWIMPGVRMPQNGITGRIPPRYSQCRHFARTGNCRVGHGCRFAHGDAELAHWNENYTLSATEKQAGLVAAAGAVPLAAPPPMPAPPPIHPAALGTTPLGAGLGAAGYEQPYESFMPPRQPPVASTLLKQPKTFVLCRHFSIKGECKSGGMCKFAHGVHELDYWNALAGRQRASITEISHQMTVNYSKADQPRVPRQKQQQQPQQQQPPTQDTTEAAQPTLSDPLRLAVSASPGAAPAPQSE